MPMLKEFGSLCQKNVKMSLLLPETMKMSHWKFPQLWTFHRDNSKASNS